MAEGSIRREKDSIRASRVEVSLQQPRSRDSANCAQGGEHEEREVGGRDVAE